jgi:hypothetical protein
VRTLAQPGISIRVRPSRSSLRLERRRLAR